MNKVKVEFTREKFYEEAWRKTMVSLAKEYGLSDTGLRNICKSLQIPLPPQGYFLLKRKGSPPPPLPPATKNMLTKYVANYCHPPAHLQDTAPE